MTDQPLNPYEPPKAPGDVPVMASQSSEWTPTGAIEYGVRSVFKQPISIAIALVGFLINLVPTLILEFVYVIPTMTAPPDVRFRAAMTMYAWLFALMPVQAYFVLGQLRFTLAAARGQPAGFAEFIAPTRYLPFLVAWLAYYFASVIGTMLCCVPGVFVMIAFMPFAALICDGRAGIVESFVESFRLTRNQWLNLFLFGLLGILVYIAGFIALCAGLLIALPAIYFAYAYIYMKQIGEEPKAVAP